jgi:hypothetical protein
LKFVMGAKEWKRFQVGAGKEGLQTGFKEEMS